MDISLKTLRWPFFVCACCAWGLSTVPKWAWFAAVCDRGTYWLTLMTLIGKVGSVSGSLTDGLACEECDRVAPAYCLGSPDQLAAHCSGHPPSPSRLSTLFSPKTRPLIFKLVLHATAFLSRFAAMWFVCYIHVFLFVFSTGGLFNEIFNSLNNLKLLSDTSKLSRDSYSHLTWEV